MHSEEPIPPVGRQEMTAKIAESIEMAARLWRVLFAQKLKEEQVTLSQFMALRSLDLYGPLSSRKLGDLLHVSSGAVTQVIDSLADKKYVVRSADDKDRRVVALQLTDAGQALIVKLQSIRQEVFAMVFKSLNDDDLDALYLSTEKILEQLTNRQKQ